MSKNKENIITNLCKGFGDEEYTETNYKWVIPEISPLTLKEYETKEDVPDILARVLINRGISVDEYEVIKDGAAFRGLMDEYISKIKDLNIVAEKIVEKIHEQYADKNSNITTYAFCDYDMDGITSGAIFNDFFSNLYKILDINKERLKVHIPERKDGYGLNMKWCETLVQNKKADDDLFVITFDNGVTKVAEIQYLINSGIEVIVTDHHEPEEYLPSCLVLDPKKDGDRFGEELCGAGVAFLLCMKIYYLIKDELLDEDKLILSDSIQRCLGLAAMGTIADMMPMTVFNLALTKTGLDILNYIYYPPITCLKDCFNLVELTSKDIGFNIAAAINACGQMNEAWRGYELFKLHEETLEENRARAEAIHKIYKKNKDITKKMKDMLQVEIDSGRFDKSKICVYPIKDIPYGIAGKLAQYISSSMSKPAIVLIDEGKEEIKGSARCAEDNMDLLRILKPFVDNGQIKFANGHKAACGVVFYRKYLDVIENNIGEYISELEANGEIERQEKKILYIDKVISLGDINESNYQCLTSIPYSMNFSCPNLMVEGIIDKVSVSKSNPNNVCYTLKDPETNRKTNIWVWNIYPKLYDESKYSKMRIVGSLNRNFMNPQYFTLDVVDIKFS